MTRLSDGSIDVAIPAVTRKDEIGDMAQTVEVFKKGLIRARDLTEAQTKRLKRRNGSKSNWMPLSRSSN